METFRDIPGYENLYQVSNLGNVKSIIYRKQRILSPGKIKGYAQVGLFKKRKRKNCLVHRLVLLVFIGPNDLEINHKNGIKEDNRLENLEYCNRSNNMKHAFSKLGFKNNFQTKHPHKGLTGKLHHCSKKVNQYELDGKFIRTWDSVSSVKRELGITTGNISGVCTGGHKTAGGFIWRYDKQD